MENEFKSNAVVLRKRDLCKLLGISPATLDRKRVRGDFPAPIMLSAQAIGWTMAAVQAWIDSRPMAHHYIESFDMEEDDDGLPSDMVAYPREYFAEVVESVLQLMARHPVLTDSLTKAEIAMWHAFPEQIRNHRAAVIYARPTDRMMDLMKSGTIGPTRPVIKPQIEG